MQSIIAFILAHQVIFAAIVVDALNFVIAFIPGIEANSIFHMVYLWLKGIASPSAK